MKFAIAALFAAATGAVAYPGNVTVVTEVVESYVTYCPSPTTITYGSSTITVTEPTTITICEEQCTITKPITTTSHTICYDCPGHNTTIPVPPPVDEPTDVPVPPTDVTEVPPPPTTTPPPSSGAGKFGVSLAGLAVIAALL